MSKTIIGLSGYARSGKDTVADYLVEHHGFRKMSFADPMRNALYALNPTIEVDGVSTTLASAVNIYSWEKLKTLSPDVRPLLQRFGTEVGRNMFGENFWVDYALNSIVDGTKVVISDVRYPNEVNAIKALGGKVYRVERDGVGPANSHASENGLDGYEFDGELQNNESVEWLYRLIENQILN